MVQLTENSLTITSRDGGRPMIFTGINARRRERMERLRQIEQEHVRKLQAAQEQRERPGNPSAK